MHKNPRGVSHFGLKQSIYGAFGNFQRYFKDKRLFDFFFPSSFQICSLHTREVDDAKLQRIAIAQYMIANCDM